MLKHVKNMNGAPVFTVAEAKRLTGGGLGYPSKMPGTSYGISAHDCITGAKLAKVQGSVCHGCYALKGNYGFANVKIAAQSTGIYRRRRVVASHGLPDKPIG